MRFPCIAAWALLLRSASAAVTEVTTANHDEFKAANNVVVIAYTSSSTDASAVAFFQAAERYLDDDHFRFGLTADEAATAAAGVTPPAVVIYRKFDEPCVDFSKANFIRGSSS
ncbi:hypothetical protein AURDEDRAFT_177506, partial [Auricularia subglabra TFB-10046 SS5]